MTLKQIEYFAAVANEGTFQAAAEKLHITQPPLSVQIRLLEDEIGAALFFRGPRHAELTDAGRLFLGRAESILELENIAEQEMHDYIAGNKGILRIGFASSTGSILLDQLVMPFSGKNPGVRFELTESNTYRLLEMLEGNLIDAAVIRTPFESDKDFAVCKIQEDYIYAVGKASFFQEPDKTSQRDPGAAGSEHFPVVTLASLSSLPLIVYRRWKNVLDDAFERRHLCPDYFCIADDARTCLSWAEKGLGAAVVPGSSADNLAIKKLRLEKYRISRPEIITSVCFVTRKSGYMSVPLQNMMSALSLSQQSLRSPDYISSRQP